MTNASGTRDIPCPKHLCKTARTSAYWPPSVSPPKSFQFSSCLQGNVTALPVLTPPILDPVTFVTRFEPSSLNVIRRASYDQDSVAGGIVHRHLVMFASLFLFLWAAISTGCSSKPAEESSDSSAPSSKSASLFGPKEVTLPAGTVITVRLASTVGSKLSAKGEHFSAIVARPVEVNGKVVLPA